MTRGLIGCVLVLASACGGKAFIAEEEPTNGAEWSVGSGGDGSEPVAPVTLCDGSPGYRFFYFSYPGGMGGGSREIVFRNGHPFLHIMGDCTYFARVGDSHTAPTVTGRLTNEEAAAFVLDLRLSGLGALDGTRAHNGGDDTPSGYIVFAGSKIMCGFDCDWQSIRRDEEEHAAIAPIFEKVVAWRDQLSARGQPLDGPVRVAVQFIDAEKWTFEAVEWPLQASPLEFSSSATDRYPQSYLVSGDAAQALRKLRAESGEFPFGFRPIELDGRYYDVVIDDALPGEDERGSVLPR